MRRQRLRKAGHSRSAGKGPIYRACRGPREEYRLTPTARGTLRNFLRFGAAAFRASPRQTLAGGAVMLGLAVTEGAGLLLLVPLLKLVGVDTASGSQPAMAGMLATAFSAVGLRPTLAAVLALYITIAILQTMLQRWQAMLSVGVQETFAASLRTRLYLAIESADWIFVSNSRASDHTHVLTEEVRVVSMIANELVDLAVLIAVSCVYLGLAIHLSAGAAALISVCGIGLGWALRGKVEEARVWGYQGLTSKRHLHRAVVEQFASMKIARSYDITLRHMGIFSRLSQEMSAANLKARAAQAGLQQRLSLGSTMMLALIVYVSYEVLAMPAATLLVLLFVFARLMPRLTEFYRRAQQLVAVLPVFDSVNDFEGRAAAAAEPRSSKQRDIDCLDRIRFERVTFEYGRSGQAPAIRAIDLDILAGSTTALVGPSGAGKSTIADLLIGLIGPTSGRLLVDGVPLGPDHASAWREQIGYVPQETFLFHDTVRANLLWARPEATDADIWHALHLAAADEFVSALPQGLDTIIGDRGVLVSGGERQRLSLARALIRRPRILILDEATGSLDSENELRIQQAVEELHWQMTIVIITHRLTAIRAADMIHVIDNGRLVESGTWDALRSKRAGRFRELCAAQGIDDFPIAAMRLAVGIIG